MNKMIGYIFVVIIRQWLTLTNNKSEWLSHYMSMDVNVKPYIKYLFPNWVIIHQMYFVDLFFNNKLFMLC